MSGAVLRNGILFGVGFFILYGVSHLFVLGEGFTWEGVLFTLAVTVPSTITWGVITHLMKKKHVANRE